MSRLTKIINTSQGLRALCFSFNSLSLKNVTKTNALLSSGQQLYCPPVGCSAVVAATRNFSTTPKCNNLMEFFDDPKNWSENEVKVGRAWKLDELRIKSNKDLHMLWYVLLKERNMLLTMEYECNEKVEAFPSPERLDKVKISMKNLETVVRERNKAYHLLETGETGERPQRLVRNKLGFQYMYKSCEHALPPYINTKWIKSRSIGYGGYAVRKFLMKYREKLYNEKRKAKNRNRNEVMMLLRRDPNLDLNLIRNKYPDVNIDKLISTDKIRGHFVPKVET